MTHNSSLKPATPTKPPRPFGLTLAVLGALLLFFIIPLLEIALILVLDSTFIVENGVSMSGINISGIDYTAIAFQVFLSVSYFIIALLTLSGIRPIMRFVFPVTTIGLTLMHTFLRIVPMLVSPRSFTDGFDSASEFARQYAAVHLIMMIVIVLYTIWFLNRWSARAFFRGNYTQSDLATIQKLYE